MIDIFDIMGPIMVGPSSSHTAGAVRIGRIGRKLLASRPVKAAIHLHGSFAETGVGHGTDRALVAGLLGMTTDDLNIPNSFSIAAEQGLNYTIDEVELRDAHPNSVRMELTGEDGSVLSMQACSTGGGRIMVTQMNGVQLNFTGEFNTLIIRNQDDRGPLADVCNVLSLAHVNVANMGLHRDSKGGNALMIIEVDEKIPQHIQELLKNLRGILSVTYYEREV